MESIARHAPHGGVSGFLRSLDRRPHPGGPGGAQGEAGAGLPPAENVPTLAAMRDHCGRFVWFALRA